MMITVFADIPQHTEASLHAATYTVRGKLLRTTSGLEPYAGPWNELTAAHLLRRTMYGPKRSEILSAASSSLDTVLTQLFAPPPTHPIPPDPNVPGRDWTVGPYSDIVQINYQYDFAIKKWWVGLMLTQGISVVEKMTLLLHNHFASQASIVGDARYMYKQNTLFRQFALGNLKELTKAVTIDPAMLVYLNGFLNKIPSPDENYARELQELFTIGKGPEIADGNYTNYTEQDVKAAARVLTGWTVHHTTNPPASVFVQKNHDSGSKQFSSAYQNTVIKPTLNPDGTMNGSKEISDLIEMIFLQPATARCFCRKLYRWFVYYDIDDTVEQNVIVPLADIMMKNNFEVKPVLDTLFRSAHFFDPNNIGCVIKNPVEFAVGTARRLNLPLPGSADPEFVKVTDALRDTAWSLQMDLLEPPNVAGWPAYHQAPDYHEIWISTTALPTRGKFTDTVLNGIHPQGSTTTYKIDPVAYAAAMSNPSDPFKLVDEITSDLLPPIEGGAAITPEQKNYLLYNVMGLVQNDEYEWTANWNNAQKNPPDSTALTTVTKTLKSLLRFVMRMAEFQLT